MYWILEGYNLFNDGKSHLRNIMLGTIIMYRQFTCSSIIKHIRFMVSESYLNSVDVEPTYCKLHL